MQVPHHLGRPYRLGPGTPECRRAGTDAAGAALPHLALHLIAPRAQRAMLLPRSRRWRMAHLLHQVLTTRSRERGPGRRGPCWPRLGARPPVSGVQLASYTGLAPVTRRSGSSVRGEHVSHSGNKRLKRAMFLSAFASLRSDPVSWAYYQRKRD